MMNLKRRQLLYLSLHAESHMFEHEHEHKQGMHVELELVDDAMAWCEEEEMSPHTESSRQGSKKEEEKVKENPCAKQGQVKRDARNVLTV